MKTKFTYEEVKAHYESIKPIRGRAVEIRPCGSRRKDWQQIVKHDDGSYSYSLYQTDCVTFKPDDTIIISANYPDRGVNWHTPCTGEFITAWSPFYAYKRHNVLWVSIYNTKVPLVKPLVIKYVRERTDVFTNPYEPEYQKYYVRQINRARAKESRKDFEPFLRWLKTFLSMSDGWVNFETLETVRKDLPKLVRAFDDPKEIIRDVQRDVTNIDNYLAILANLIERATGQAYYEMRQATTLNPQNSRWARDYRFKYETLRKHLYKRHDEVCPEIFDAVPVIPDDRERMNVIKQGDAARQYIKGVLT